MNYEIMLYAIYSYEQLKLLAEKDKIIEQLREHQCKAPPEIVRRLEAAEGRSPSEQSSVAFIHLTISATVFNTHLH